MSIPKRLRFEILERDNHTCQYCGGKPPEVRLHVDHILPKSKGGKDTRGNLITSCRDCNLGKGTVIPQRLKDEWADAELRCHEDDLFIYSDPHVTAVWGEPII